LETEEGWSPGPGNNEYDALKKQHWMTINLGRDYKICAVGVRRGLVKDPLGEWNQYISGYVYKYTFKWHYKGRWQEKVSFVTKIFEYRIIS